MKVFERLESQVRGYCRSFPTVFTQALGAILVDERGRRYVDFFAGAGALNYGHNHPHLKQALIRYLERDGVVHALDMATGAKRMFLERFDAEVLAPRGLRYRVQFTGPTGTNAVEAALKLARKVTGRQSVVAFTDAFHGMTLGSLAMTGNGAKRRGAGLPLGHCVRMPYDGFLGEGVNTLDVLRAMLEDSSSGVDKPAAVILETIQAEGGVNVASPTWLHGLAELTAEHGVLLIVDDIQVGCGRTGSFFSFEKAGIRPDIVCLSKSLSGYGLPFAVTLIRPDLDVWNPGEHNGTFRGFNPAMVTATAALDFWEDGSIQREVARKSERIRQRLQAMADDDPRILGLRGRGMIQGLVMKEGLANQVSREAFEHGLIIETAGPRDEVLKLLPPLTIEDEHLTRGLDVLEESLRHTTRSRRPQPEAPETVIQA